MFKIIVKMFKKISDLPNSNIIKNSDGLLLIKNFNFHVDWVGKTKQSLPQNIYKISD